MNVLQSGEKDEGGGGGESALSKWTEARKGKKEKKQKLVGKPGNLSSVTARQIERHRESSFSLSGD